MAARFPSLFSPTTHMIRNNVPIAGEQGFRWLAMVGRCSFAGLLNRLIPRYDGRYVFLGSDLMATPFCYRRLVQFAETDMGGIVHFSNFFRYMEEAEHAMLRSFGLNRHAPDRWHLLHLA